MNEQIKKRLEENAGKEALLFDSSDYRYVGTIISCDGEFLELDDKKCGLVFLNLDKIKSINILNKRGVKDGTLGE